MDPMLEALLDADANLREAHEVQRLNFAHPEVRSVRARSMTTIEDAMLTHGLSTLA